LPVTLTTLGPSLLLVHSFEVIPGHDPPRWIVSRVLLVGCRLLDRQKYVRIVAR
jgi:hypothetical protein